MPAQQNSQEPSQSRCPVREFENIKEFAGWVFKCLFAPLLQQLQSDSGVSLTRSHAGFFCPEEFSCQDPSGDKKREHKSQAWICGWPWFADQKEQLSL